MPESEAGSKEAAGGQDAAPEDQTEPAGDRRAMPALAILGLVALAAAGGFVLFRARQRRAG